MGFLLAAAATWVGTGAEVNLIGLESRGLSGGAGYLFWLARPQLRPARREGANKNRYAEWQPGCRLIVKPPRRTQGFVRIEAESILSGDFSRCRNG